MLLATGVVDRVPAIPGIEHFYGRSVHHCPYCDGWEKREQPLAAYGPGEKGVGLALMLTLWSRDIVLCTDGRQTYPMHNVSNWYPTALRCVRNRSFA